jgi:hypothetical protein
MPTLASRAEFSAAPSPTVFGPTPAHNPVTDLEVADRGAHLHHLPYHLMPKEDAPIGGQSHRRNVESNIKKEPV